MTVLYFAPFFQKTDLWGQAVWIIAKWKKIKGFAEGATSGTCAEIKRNGRAEIYRL